MSQNGRNKILIIWAVIILVCAGYIYSQVKIVTDVSQFMPAAGSKQDQLLLNQLNSGITPRLILIALEGKDKNLLSKMSRNYAAKLRESKLFHRVDNGENLIDKNERTLLKKYRYLLDNKTNQSTFTAPMLEVEFRQRFNELTSPTSTFNKKSLREDPTNAFLNLTMTLTQSRGNKTKRGLWFSKDGHRALLLAETIAPGYALDKQQLVINTLNDAFTELSEDNKVIQLHISGPSVFAVNSSNSIRTETQILSGIASAAILLITILAFRSARVVLTSALPLASAIIVATSCVGLIFGEIHGITLAFGITLLGVAIDYPIHVFSHLSNDSTVVSNIRKIWPTLRLGILTTMVAYLAMISPGFSGLAQLGLFAMIGLMVAAIITRWILPALMPETWTPGHKIHRAWLEHILMAPSNARILIAITIALAAIVILWQHDEPFWEENLTALSPIPKKAIALDHQLRNDIGASGVNHLLVISTVHLEETLEQSEQLTKALQALIDSGTISGYDMASKYLPSHKTQTERQSYLPTEPDLRSALNQAVESLPFDVTQFEPFVQAVTQAKTLPPLELNDLSGTSTGIRVSSLIFANNDQWTAIVPLSGLKQEEQILSWLSNQNNPNLSYLNITAASNLLINNYRSAAFDRIKWSSILILIVLVIGLRSFKQVGIAILPVLLAIILDVLILLLGFDERLTLFHLVALLLVFGIGIDYSLFFSRTNEAKHKRLQTAYALCVCALSTFTVFGILAFSNTPVLAYLGKTVALGVVLCFFSAMLLSQRQSSPNTTNNQLTKNDSLPT